MGEYTAPPDFSKFFDKKRIIQRMLFPQNRRDAQSITYQQLTVYACVLWGAGIKRKTLKNS